MPFQLSAVLGKIECSRGNESNIVLYLRFPSGESDFRRTQVPRRVKAILSLMLLKDKKKKDQWSPGVRSKGGMKSTEDF